METIKTALERMDGHKGELTSGMRIPFYMQEIAELRAALAKNEAQMLRMATCAGEFARDACKSDSERDAAQPAIPEGWALNQADFSIIAAGGIKPGYVMLVRTGDDRSNWHKFADADAIPLYATGKGMTLDEALQDAISEAKNSPPVPTSAMAAQQGEKDD